MCVCVFNEQQQDISKRLSLPADLRIPESFLAKQSSPLFEGPLTRTDRRQSLSEIGFGRMETYTKLDKLGEVSHSQLFPSVFVCLFDCLFVCLLLFCFSFISHSTTKKDNNKKQTKQKKQWIKRWMKIWRNVISRSEAKNRLTKSPFSLAISKQEMENKRISASVAITLPFNRAELIADLPTTKLMNENQIIMIKKRGRRRKGLIVLQRDDNA